MNTTPPGSGTHTDPHSQHAPPRPAWRFVRRERGRMIAGVASGMADAFHIDVTVMRVIWVVAAIATGGLGAAAYAICWIAFPSDEHAAPMSDVRHHRHNAGFIVGSVLLGLGLVIVFGQISAPFRRGGDVVWATVLIGAGLAVLLLRHPDDELPPPGPFAPGPYAGPPPAPETVATGDPNATTATSDARSEADAPAETGDASDPSQTGSSAEPGSTAETTSTAWSQFTPWPTPPAPPSWSRPHWSERSWPTPPYRPRHRSFLTPLTLSLLLIGAGVIVLLDNAGSTHVTVAEALAGGVALIGLALVASAWFGRARGLVPIGILLLIVAVPATALDVPLSGGVGHRDYAPTTRAALRSRYELGIGRLSLDLQTTPLAHHTTHLVARVGIGELTIDVPSTVRVVVHAHAGAGSVRVFGGSDGGWPENATLTASGSQSGTLYVDARVGAGDVQVHRFEPDGVETLLGADR